MSGADEKSLFYMFFFFYVKINVQYYQVHLDFLWLFTETKPR